MPYEVEGIDYTPEGIETLRQALIRFRDTAMAMGRWDEAVALTHTIALLAYLKELVQGI